LIVSFVLAAAVAASPAPAPSSSARLTQVSETREAVAVLSCLVKRDGALTACTVQSESPAEMGVGAAALSMAAQFQVELMGPDGKSRAGSFIDVPVRIRLR
jgi:hypothetical protein